MLNSKSYGVAVNSIFNKLQEGFDEFNLKRVRKKVVALVAAIEDKHKAISEFFYRQEGTRLQKEDSSIMIECIKVLNSKEIACLTVHDSIIVKKQHRDELYIIMVDTMRALYDIDSSYKLVA